MVSSSDRREAILRKELVDYHNLSIQRVFILASYKNEKAILNLKFQYR